MGNTTANPTALLSHPSSGLHGHAFRPEHTAVLRGATPQPLRSRYHHPSSSLTSAPCRPAFQRHPSFPFKIMTAITGSCGPPVHAQGSATTSYAQTRGRSLAQFPLRPRGPCSPLPALRLPLSRPAATHPTPPARWTTSWVCAVPPPPAPRGCCPPAPAARRSCGGGKSGHDVGKQGEIRA